MLSSFLERRLSPLIQKALVDTPVVLLNGPRQAGKTTLASSFAACGFRMLSLDDAATLTSAQLDPTGLVRSLDRAVIDEVQRAPARRICARCLRARERSC